MEYYDTTVVGYGSVTFEEKLLILLSFLILSQNTKTFHSNI